MTISESIPALPMIENHTFEEIKVGDTAHLLRTLQAPGIQLFAAMSGDVNPAHVDPEYAHSISKSSVHFVGFASRTSVLSSLRLRVHE